MLITTAVSILPSLQLLDCRNFIFSDHSTIKNYPQHVQFGSISNLLLPASERLLEEHTLKLSKPVGSFEQDHVTNEPVDSIREPLFENGI